MQFSGGPGTGTSKRQTCRTATMAPQTFQSFPGGSQVSKDIRGHIFNAPNWGLSKGNCNHMTWSTYPQRPPISPGSSGSSRWENHTTRVSLCTTRHTCNAHMHMCTVTHVCTHTDSSGQSSWAGEKDLQLCQERNTMRRSNPHRCARAGEQGQTDTHRQAF